MALRYTGKATEMINELRLNRATFKVRRTSKTTKVKRWDKDAARWDSALFADKHYYGQIFGLLAQLKTQLDNNADIIEAAPLSSHSRDIKYFSFNETIRNLRLDQGTIYNIPNVIEADITMAYYKTAFNLGFIDSEFYYRCLKLDKIDRLILIGSIATISTEEDYVDGILVHTELFKNDLHRTAWFKICSYVDTALMTLKKKLDSISPDIFLFYWVDGIYFREFSMPNVEYTYVDVLNELKQLFPFEWKIQKMKRVRVINLDGHLKIELKKRNGDTKEFFPSKEEIKMYFLDKDGTPQDIWTDLLTNTLKFK